MVGFDISPSSCTDWSRKGWKKRAYDWFSKKSIVLVICKVSPPNIKMSPYWNGFDSGSFTLLLSCISSEVSSSRASNLLKRSTSQVFKNSQGQVDLVGMEVWIFKFQGQVEQSSMNAQNIEGQSGIGQWSMNIWSPSHWSCEKCKDKLVYNNEVQVRSWVKDARTYRCRTMKYGHWSPK